MERDEIIKGLYQIKNWKCDGDAEMYEVIESAIEALQSDIEFQKRYDEFWEEVKASGEREKEVEIHHSGRVFRIRKVVQMDD